MKASNRLHPPQADYIEIIHGVSFKMIFVAGSPTDNIPSFHIGETPVTEELWYAVMGDYPKGHIKKGNKYPQIIHDIRYLLPEEHFGYVDNFFNSLNKQTKNRKYSLTNEGIWQYAAFNQQDKYAFSGSNNDKEVGWFWNGSSQESMPVKLKIPNQKGLYDMSGNVWECCFNYPENITLAKGRNMIVCGGSFFNNKQYGKLPSKDIYHFNNEYKDIGFRIMQKDKFLF